MKTRLVSPFIGNALKLAGGSAIGQGLILLTTPLITRIYGPAEMGQFGVFMAFVAFASVAISLRYDLAIVAARTRLEADLLLVSSIALSIPCSALASAWMLVMVHFGLLGYMLLPPWSALAMFAVLVATGVFTALRFWHVGNNRFGEIGVALVSQGAARAVFPLLLATLSSAWTGLLGGEMLGRLLGVGRLARNAWPGMCAAMAPGHRSQYLDVLRRYWKYPSVFLPSSLLDALAGALPLPIIATLFGIEAAGQYFLVYRLASAPAALVSAGVADVFHARVMQLAGRRDSAVHRALGSTAARLAMIGTAVYLPVALASPFLFSLVFGEAWQPTGDLMAVQSLACITGLVVSPLSRALAASRIPESKLLSDLVRLTLPIVGLWLCHQLEMAFLPTIIVFSVLSAISDVFYMAVIWYATADQRQINHA